MRGGTLVTNPRALRQYKVLGPLQAGISLTGAEVKSLRAGRASLTGSFVRIKSGEAFLENAFIAPFEKAHPVDSDPRRSRKLLLKKDEIAALSERLGKGLTIVPLRVYTNARSLIKVSIALVKGKKKHDKREEKKKKELRKEMSKLI